MCLRIASKKLKAETDLLVYKCLDKYGFHYSTPYLYVPVLFKNGKVDMIGDCRSLEIETDTDNFLKNGEVISIKVKVINHGIHAYYLKRRADETSIYFKRTCGTATYYAIIPKGSHYYIGTDNDIVSTRLTIFLNKREYDKYAETHKIEKIKKDKLKGVNALNSANEG